MAEVFKKEIVQRICRCLLDVHVLILIQRRPLWGYRLKQDLETSFDVTLRHGTLYPLLNNLELRGLVTSQTQKHKGRERRVYRTTRKGMQYLGTYTNIVKEQIHLIETASAVEPLSNCTLTEWRPSKQVLNNCSQVGK